VSGEKSVSSEISMIPFYASEKFRKTRQELRILFDSSGRGNWIEKDPPPLFDERATSRR
jgi:hypothetical protein